jgi:hypothetical protein
LEYSNRSCFDWGFKISICKAIKPLISRIRKKTTGKDNSEEIRAEIRGWYER